jgi:hypothetical protein
LPFELRGFLILPLFGVHVGQTAVGWVFARVALNLLLIGLGCFFQFPSYIRIVVGCDPAT